MCAGVHPSAAVTHNNRAAFIVFFFFDFFVSFFFFLSFFFFFLSFFLSFVLSYFLSFCRSVDPVGIAEHYERNLTRLFSAHNINFVVCPKVMLQNSLTTSVMAKQKTVIGTGCY